MNTTYTAEQAEKMRQDWINSLDRPKRKKTVTYKINYSSGDGLWWVGFHSSNRARTERILTKNHKSVADARAAAEAHAGEPLDWQDCDYFGSPDYSCCEGFALLTTTN